MNRSVQRNQLRVISYNIHQCIGRDKREDPHRTASLIQDLDAQIVGIQELGSYRAQPDSFGSLQIDTIMQVTGMMAITGPTIHHRNSSYGNCLLTREAVVSVDRLNITIDGCEPRGLLDVVLMVDGHHIRVLVTHLGLRRWERRQQVSRIIKQLQSGAQIPTLLMGDFNEWLPWSRTIHQIERYFKKSPGLKTFPAWFPCLALDRIWVYPREVLIRLKAIGSTESRLASDHLPLEAVIDLPALQRSAKDSRAVNNRLDFTQPNM